MKQFLLALCATCLLFACNNEKKTDNGFGGNLFGDPNAKNNNANNNIPVNNGGQGGRWSKQLKEYVYNACLQEAGNAAQARDVCDCWTGKLEAKYPGLKDPNQISEDVANQLAMECLGQAGAGKGTFGDDGFNGFDEGGFNYDDGNYGGEGYDGYPNNNGGYPNNNGGYNNNPGGRATPWPAAQRKQWIMGCTTTAQQQQGMTQQQAAAYCECMTKKVEAKYSFTDATRLTAADFSTQEWVMARNECMGGYGGDF